MAATWNVFIVAGFLFARGLHEFNSRFNDVPYKDPLFCIMLVALRYENNKWCQLGVIVHKLNFAASVLSYTLQGSLE